MSAELPGHEFGAAHAPGKTSVPSAAHPAADRALRFTRRLATRIAWREHPVVRLRHVVSDDALIVEILPLKPATDRVVEDLLCIEFDGTDSEAFPTSLCLTGFIAEPHSAAALAARHLLGETLCGAAEEMVQDGDTEREVLLDESVRDARVRTWRRLTGLAVGVEVLPGELRAALVGADGEIIAREQRSQPLMSPDAVIAGITALVADMRIEHRALIAGTPVHLGVQIGGPVDARSGVVNAFRRRGRPGSSTANWENVPLAEMVEDATGLRTHVLNDVAGYAAYDRWFYPSPDEPCRAVLLISEGIGGKLIIDGDVSKRMPMEIGNFTLHENGAPCECGRFGCLEATASTRAIVDRVEEVSGQTVDDIECAVALAEPIEPSSDRATEVFRTAGRDLARGISTVQVIAHPSSWAIYGPACLVTKSTRAGDAFFGSLENYDQWVAFDTYQNSPIRRRPIEGDEGAHGAALAALERFGIAGPHRNTSIAAADRRRILARMAWHDRPVLHLKYDRSTDVLTVDALAGPDVDDRRVHGRLLVRLDGEDGRALPTTIELRDFAGNQLSDAAYTARKMLGPTAWREARNLTDDLQDEADVKLDAAERDRLLREWARFAQPVRVVGVQVLPGLLRAVLVDHRGAPVDRTKLISVGMHADAVADGIAELAMDLWRAATDGGVQRAIGVQIAGPVDQTTGIVHYYNKGSFGGDAHWEDVNLGERIAELTGAPTLILNDVDALTALEQWTGLGQQTSRYGVILVDEGVGGALVTNGALDMDSPMEIGTIIVHRDGRPCRCGDQGCVEATVGTSALVQQIAECTGVDLTDLRSAVLLAEADDPAIADRVQKVLRDAGADLAFAIGASMALQNPAAYAVYLPRELHHRRAAGQAFWAGVDESDVRVSYKPLRGASFHRRYNDDNGGALSAGLAALERFGLSGPRWPVQPREIDEAWRPGVAAGHQRAEIPSSW